MSEGWCGFNSCDGPPALRQDLAKAEAEVARLRDRAERAEAELARLKELLRRRGPGEDLGAALSDILKGDNDR